MFFPTLLHCRDNFRMPENLARSEQRTLPLLCAHGKHAGLSVRSGPGHSGVAFRPRGPWLGARSRLPGCEGVLSNSGRHVPRTVPALPLFWAALQGPIS